MPWRSLAPPWDPEKIVSDRKEMGLREAASSGQVCSPLSLTDTSLPWSPADKGGGWDKELKGEGRDRGDDGYAQAMVRWMEGKPQKSGLMAVLGLQSIQVLWYSEWEE